MVGAICIILFMSMLFVLYDFFVRREFNSKKELLEAKRKFVRFVSHEVRTPLNTVCMGLTLMQDEIGAALKLGAGHSNSKNASSSKSDSVTAASTIMSTLVSEESVSDWFNQVNQILNNAQSAVGVLSDLLNYDRIEMGSLHLELSVLPVWALIERTAQEFQSPAANQKIQFLVNYIDDCNGDGDSDKEAGLLMFEALSPEMKELQAVGDKVRVMQALRNLISNAIKFTPEGGKWKEGRKSTLSKSSILF